MGRIFVLFHLGQSETYDPFTTQGLTKIRFVRDERKKEAWQMPDAKIGMTDETLEQLTPEQMTQVKDLLKQAFRGKQRCCILDWIHRELAQVAKESGLFQEGRPRPALPPAVLALPDAHCGQCGHDVRCTGAALQCREQCPNDSSHHNQLGESEV